MIATAESVTYDMVCERAFTVKDFLCKILAAQNDESALKKVINEEFTPNTISDNELKRVRQKLQKSDRAGVNSGEVLDYICALNPPPSEKSLLRSTTPPKPWQ